MKINFKMIAIKICNDKEQNKISKKLHNLRYIVIVVLNLITIYLLLIEND